MRLRRDPTLRLTTELRRALEDGPDAWGLGDRGLSERELRSAWERHGDEVLAEPRDPGTRPWAWWRFEAGREAVYEPDLDDPDHGAKADDAEAESVGFLAARGELRGDEIEVLRARGAEARRRIGTDAERGTLTERGWHGSDRAAVKVAEAIEKTLRPRPRREGAGGNR